MEKIQKKTEVMICLGSSCYSRGNKDTLEIIKKYIDENGLSDKINFRGKLCANLCSSGPNITINEITYKAISSFDAIRLIEQSIK